ncbi:filamentous hemagglutinin N-terminal domain-containing protein, partial [bacterium]|nr:filamentous hemagglutinin N-terminal domain-containing protein [bacterium]
MKIFIFLFSLALFANPESHAPVNGKVLLQENGNLLQVTTSDRAIIHWESFSIAPNETTRFIQPSVDSAVLNRVIGSEMSNLLGQLHSNGRVYLVNPNGIFIGSEGSINAAAFMATTLDIKDGEFLSGENLTLESNVLSGIVNLGTINTSSGPIALAAHKIENSGLLKAPTVLLTAAHKILFDPTGDCLIYIQPDLKAEGIESNGDIEALKTVLQADAAPTTLAIGLGGLIDANLIENVDGEIYLIAKEGDILIANESNLKASKVTLHAEEGLLDMQGNIISPSGLVHMLGKSVYLQGDASIDASGDFQGGTILVGGDYKGSNPDIPNAEYTFCGTNARVDCSAKLKGDGGKAIFWGDKGIAFHSKKVKAEGGKEGGDGGFVEVSSPGSFAFSGHVSRLAPNGKAGTLLLDPSNITISSAATAGGAFAAGTFTATLGTANILNTELNAELASGNVIIDATSGPAGPPAGNITFDPGAPVSWSANDLNLNVPRDITFNGEMNISGTATLSGTAPITLNILSSAVITHTSSAPLTFSSASFIDTSGGEIISNSAATITLTARGITLNNLTLTQNGNGSVAITKIVSGTGALSVTNGSNITLNGSGTLSFTLPNGNPHTFSNCTLSSNTPITFSAVGGFNFSDTINVNCSTLTMEGISSVGSTTLNSSAGSVSFPFGVGGDNFIISAPNANLSFGGSSFIESLNVNAGGNITSENFADFTIFGGPFAMTAGNDIVLSNFFFATSAGPITLVAGHSFIPGPGAFISTNGPDDVTLVIDNENPNPPNIGSQSFNFDNNFEFQTDGGSGIEGNGKVLIFSTTPQLTTLPTTINTVAYTKGTFS